MASTFSGLEIGKSGLTAAQIGLNISGQNISNADTDGYTMQKVKTAPIEAVGGGYLIRQVTSSSNVGQGVAVLSIDQIRSAYLDQQYRNQYSDFSSDEYRSQGLSYLENLFNETNSSTSITKSISSFFNALNGFAEDTKSEAARTTVQQSALSMTENFNMIYNEMIDLYNDQNTSIKTVSTQINQLSSQIADLNKQIFEYEYSGQKANDLRDTRNNLLDTLSGYANISYEEADDGMVNVSLCGETLVSGETSGSIGITTAADEINSLCGTLSALNTEISGTYGGITQEQADKRDGLIKSLKSVSDKISCTAASDGTTSVSLQYVDNSTMTSATKSLIDGSNTLTAAGTSETAEYDGAYDKYVLRLGATYLNSDNVSSGELNAHLLLRDSDTATNGGIPYYISRMNDLAQTIAKTLNGCMNKGYTYPDDENGGQSVNGINLFKDFGTSCSLITGGNFTLSDEVLKSVWNLAGSAEKIDLNSTSGTTNAGNSVIATEMSKLASTNGYSDCLDSIVSQLGLEVKSSKNSLSTKQSLLESTEGQRQSVSGVSIDEEAVSLIKYQQVYSACSRVVTTIDQMLEKLINGTGTVGLS